MAAGAGCWVFGALLGVRMGRKEQSGPAKAKARETHEHQRYWLPLVVGLVVLVLVPLIHSAGGAEAVAGAFLVLVGGSLGAYLGVGTLTKVRSLSRIEPNQ